MEDIEKKNWERIRRWLPSTALAAIFVFSLYQIALPTAEIPPEVGSFVESPIGILIFTLAAIFLGSWFLVYLIRKFLHHRTRMSSSFKNIVLLVTVPKESAGRAQAQEKREITVQTIQEGIATAEALFASIGGLKAQKGIGAWLTGRTDYLSFEIVADKGLISFYVAVPKHLQEYVEQQIRANYHEAFIEEIKDYNIFTPTGDIRGAYLTFKRPHFFPIKTYKKMETDPMNGLTNILSKLEKNEGAAIQFVLRSARKEWRRSGIKIAQEMQQGKKFDEAMRSVSGNIFMKILGEIGKMFAGGQKKKPEDQIKPQPEVYRLSPMEEEMVKGLEEKASKAGVDVNIRIVSSSPNSARAKMNLDNITNAFSQYNIYQYGNSFARTAPGGRPLRKIINNFIHRSFMERRKVVLNSEEMASLFHFPSPWTEAPNIQWLLAKKAAPPVNMPREGLILGRSTYRGTEMLVKIKREDRRRHVYMIGKSGVGKTNLMESMIVQDIANGEGVAVVDPHGDLIEYILAHVPKERIDDIIVFDPSDIDRPIGLNMLEAKDESQKDFAVQEMISIFYKLFPPEMIGPMFEHNMRNVMLTLMSDLENPGTIAEIPRMFSDNDFQKSWVAKVKDPVVRSFWEKEMAKTSDFHKSEMLGYLISKVGKFVENEMMRNIIGQSRSGFNLREIMDKKKVLLVNLSKGRTGEINASLLGLIIVSKLQMAALSRADLPEEQRHDFYLYIDEFQNFITDSIATILSEARKYKLCLNIAHQYVGQLVKDNKTEIRDAVFGNAGTMVSFRIGVDDAEIIAKEFAPTVNEYDLLNVEKYTAYIKLLIDNTASKPFNMQTEPPTKGDLELAQAIKQLSRLKYGRDKSIVEAEISERTQLGTPASVAGPMAGERSL
ncbi:type IV secretion system DNA-binding domain-containing protein [Patescibacteria group bacterium]|nr:type IV secretion system DNA-binding domain-containing protein [Patescibacteria group bacterium]